MVCSLILKLAAHELKRLFARVNFRFELRVLHRRQLDRSVCAAIDEVATDVLIHRMLDVTREDPDLGAAGLQR